MRLKYRDGKKRIVFVWDAADGRNGGAERTASETLFKMARFDHRTGEMDQGAITPVPDLVQAFERVSLPVVWAWATFFNFPKKILRVFCPEFENWLRVQFEGCVAEPLQTVTAILLGSKLSFMLLRIVVQDAWSEVAKVYQPTTLKVIVDDITAIMETAKQGTAMRWRQNVGGVKNGSGREGFEAVDHGRRKGGKSKVIARCSYL